MTWREVNVQDPAEVRALHERYPGAVHHFWFEPWNETGAAVRISDGPASEGSAWDSLPDEVLYGEDWPLVRDFYTASARLAALGTGDHLLKVTHCHLNAQGLDVDDELWFALKFAYNRVRVILKHDLRRMLRKWVR